MTTLDITLGGLLLVLVLVVFAVYLARKDRVTRVKLGVFFEREREREYKEDELPDMQDADPEVRRWLARFFEMYPYPKRGPKEDDDQEAAS